MCVQDGVVQCFPRCPLVNLPEELKRNCSMIPNPDDPCCPVPDCLLDLFMQGGNGTFENLRINNLDFDLVFNNTTNNLGWTGGVDLRGMTSGGIEHHTIGSPFENVSLDILNKEHKENFTEEHNHLNTLIPVDRNPSFVQQLLLNSSLVPVETIGQPKPTLETLGDGFNEEGFKLLSNSEAHEGTIEQPDHDEINLTHPPERDSQLPGINIADNHHLIMQEHDSFDASTTASHTSRAPFILFGNVLNDSNGVDGTRPHGGNEVVPAFHTPGQTENITVNLPDYVNSTLNSNPFGGETVQDTSSLINTRGESREPDESDDSFDLPEDYENFHIPGSTRGTHQIFDPLKEHGKTLLPKSPSESAHVLEDDRLSFPSDIPPSSQNEADVSGHIKGIQIWKWIFVSCVV
ncbi:uncharacterized protein [Palaemon carinicauda]|uniref:uncharacterized protein isoform X2 n=1 Tax=Palaemon carinicauda TaxID=392227 RepID=UPI0035B5BEFC